MDRGRRHPEERPETEVRRDGPVAGRRRTTTTWRTLGTLRVLVGGRSAASVRWIFRAGSRRRHTKKGCQRFVRGYSWSAAGRGLARCSLHLRRDVHSGSMTVAAVRAARVAEELPKDYNDHTRHTANLATNAPPQQRRLPNARLLDSAARRRSCQRFEWLANTPHGLHFVHNSIIQHHPKQTFLTFQIVICQVSLFPAEVLNC